MQILALVPMYKVMDAICVQSLIGFQNEVYDTGDRITFVFTSGFNAAKARNLLANYAHKNENYDVVLWLDSDHIYNAKDFYSLLKTMREKKLSLLSASYKVRGGDITAHGKDFGEGVGYRQFVTDDFKELPAGEVQECDVIGFGFLVMEKQFIKDLVTKHGDDLFILDNKFNITEDVQFCKLARQDGHKICFDPNVKVGHVQVAVRI